MDHGGAYDVLLLNMCFMSFCVDPAFVVMFEYSYIRKIVSAMSLHCLLGRQRNTMLASTSSEGWCPITITRICILLRFFMAVKMINFR